MAKRFVYVAQAMAPYYQAVEVEFTYYSGFSVAQKRRCIESLHQSFEHGNPRIPVLEVSTKSRDELGVSLSAFNLTIETPRRRFSVESAFQASKVFEGGGPFTDLIEAEAYVAKRDERLRTSGAIIGFRFNGRDYPTEPKDLFYNWLYLNALKRKPALGDAVMRYQAFTDIEFNPKKSINCQAIAVARYVGLRQAGTLEDALRDLASFERVVYRGNSAQATLF